MDRGVYTAAIGGINQARNLEIITTNLAGSSMAGFKKAMPVFTVLEPSGRSQGGAAGVPGVRVLSGVGGTFTDFSQGTLKMTGNPLDIAISGEGFFVVQTSDGERYTRKGDFLLDKEGKLMTRAGDQIEGEGGGVTLTPGKISIAADGTISVNDGVNESIVDRLKIVVFKDPYHLTRVGNGLFSAPDGMARKDVGAGTSVVQGHLEMSNVNAVHEMVSMINALRIYESQMKIMKGFDEITEKAIRLAANG